MGLMVLPALFERLGQMIFLISFACLDIHCLQIPVYGLLLDQGRCIVRHLVGSGVVIASSTVPLFAEVPLQRILGENLTQNGISRSFGPNSAKDCTAHNNTDIKSA